MLAQTLPGVFAHTDPLDLDGQLFVELETYAGELVRVSNERAQKEAPRQDDPAARRRAVRRAARG